VEVNGPRNGCPLSPTNVVLAALRRGRPRCGLAYARFGIKLRILKAIAIIDTNATVLILILVLILAP